MYEPSEPIGDARAELTGKHDAASAARRVEQALPVALRFLRRLDDGLSVLV
jgi:hypothetical protein